MIRPGILRACFCLLFLLNSTRILADPDLRDAGSSFCRESAGLYGRFDRIHLRDSAGAEGPVNTVLTCFGWGVFYDWGGLSARMGLRSQLGTSSLARGCVDDEQLVLT